MSEKYFKQDPSDETKTIEVTVFKAFESEDEYNKAIQSASSKAKGDLLKEMGVSSVQDVKDKFGKIAEYEASHTKYAELEGSFNALKGEHEKTIDELITTKYGVNDDFKNEFLTLAKAGVTKDVTLLQSAEMVSKKLSTIVGTPGKIQIGGTPGGKVSPQEEMARLRKL